MSSFTWKLDNQDPPYGIKINPGTLNINYNEAGTRGVLTFNLIDENLNYSKLYLTELLIGKQIDIYENNILIYSGKIDEPEMRKIDQHPIIGVRIICVDHHKICDRIFVNQSFPKYEISYLVKLIIDTYLTDDGIWYDNDSIQYSGSFVSINCPYIYCSVVFDELAALINWQWKVGPDKKFYFDDRTVQLGPKLTEFDNHKAGSLYVRDDMSDYRNKQILRNLNVLTDELIETASPTPDNNRSYYVRFPLNSKPKIYVTTNENDPPDEDEIDPRFVGINVISEGMQWYWSKNSNTVTQDQQESDIVPPYKVVLKYVGQYNIDIVKSDNTAISQRQSIEGGSGLYEEIEDGSYIESIRTGEIKARSLLLQYCRNVRKITVSSYNHKWESGQVCEVVIPTYNINNDYLVSNLSIQDKSHGLLRTATLVDGQNVGSWVKFFKKWMEKSREYVIREDALVGIPIITNEPIEWNGEIQVIRIDCLYPRDDPGGLYPSNLLFPGTIDSTRVFYD